MTICVCGQNAFLTAQNFQELFNIDMHKNNIFIMSMIVMPEHFEIFFY